MKMEEIFYKKKKNERNWRDSNKIYDDILFSIEEK